MSQKANPAVIGMFVVIAMALCLAAIVALGAGTFFNQTRDCVLCFTGDLSGLDVGAPVEYRGVRIGSVQDIRLQYNADSGDVTIPVYAQLEKQRMLYIGTNKLDKGLEFQIEKGLRAQLQSQSLVTGKLKVMLLSAPQHPIRLSSVDHDVLEIPTIPSTMESFAQRIETLPLEEIIRDVRAGTRAFAELADSGEMESLTDGLRQAMASLNETLAETQKLLKELHTSTSPVRTEVLQAMQEISEAARSVRYFAETLDRHPEALIQGKKSD